MMHGQKNIKKWRYFKSKFKFTHTQTRFCYISVSFIACTIVSSDKI